MIFIGMYHKAERGPYGNDPAMLDAHLAYVAKHHKSLHPGENGPGVCLTFDDATADFYDVVYPLLQKYNLKAVLAVPTGLIGEKGYCTWEQITEMAKSPLIELASHTHSHPNLRDGADLEKEIIRSKFLLDAIKPTKTFVFPYGAFTQESLNCAKDHYPFVMRIGSAINRSWNQSLLYRIPCDELSSARSPFTIWPKVRYRLNYHINQWRRR